MTTTFDERERAFEKKFAVDQEARFKVTVRVSRLVGLWAAEIMGMSGQEAEDYAKSVVKAGFEERRGGSLTRKLLADFAARNIAMTAAQIEAALAARLPEATRQVEADAKAARDKHS